MLNTAESSILIVGERYIPLIKSILPELKYLKHVITLESQHSDMHFYEDIINK